MANLAECAFAVAKDDINKMDGALRKAEPNEQSKCVYKRTYKNRETGEVRIVYESYEGTMWEPSVIKVKNKDTTIEEYHGKDCKNWNAQTRLYNDGYSLTNSKVLADTTVDNGWMVDWVKLNAYSYDYTPYISEYEDHITVFFGGRWDFPSDLENTLNGMGVRWQGAGCEDGMAWQFDDGGNWDFGLRIGEETEYCDGEPYQQHFVEDTSEYGVRGEENAHEATKGDL